MDESSADVNGQLRMKGNTGEERIASPVGEGNPR